MRATGVQERLWRFYTVLWRFYTKSWRFAQIAGESSKGVEILHKCCGDSIQVV
jgi:hypothetical protein